MLDLERGVLNLGDTIILLSNVMLEKVGSCPSIPSIVSPFYTMP